MFALMMSLLALVCVFCLVYGIQSQLTKSDDSVRRRLMESVSWSAAKSRAGEPIGPLGEPKGFDQTFFLIMRFFLAPVDQRTPGLRTRGERFSLFMTLIVLCGGSVVALLLLLPFPLGLVGAWVIGCLLIRSWVNRAQRKMFQEINDGLIDVIDLWVLCLGGGMSFQAALVRVTQDPDLARPALHQELQHVNQEVLAGVPRDEALRRMAARCQESTDVRALVSHIIQSERLGSSLAQTLRVYARTLRFKRTQDMKELIQKLPVKVAFPLVFCILPSLIIVIAAPAMVRIFFLFTR